MINTYIKHGQLNKNHPSILRIILEGFAKRKVLLLSLAVIVITLPIFYLVMKYQSKTEAAWMDDSWGYRKSIAVTNNTTQQTNVYISVTLDTSDTTRFQADCGDLRFTNASGKQLKYYIVSGCRTANNVIHVLLDVFPAGSQYIYYYYGNPSAANGFSSADFSTVASNYTVGSLGTEEQSKGPIAYWKFDEGYGTEVRNSAQNSYIGSISGATWQTEDKCVSGKCLYFDGTDDVVDITSGPLLNTNDFTISVWAKYTRDLAVGGAPQHVMSNSTYSCKLPAITQDYNNLRFYIKPGVVTSPIGPTIASILNSFHQFVIIREGNVFTSYIDGKYSGTVTDSTIDLTSVLWKFGADGACAGGTAPFKGFIDDAKIYSYARTAAQIKSDYASHGSVKGVSVQMGASNKNLEALSNGLVSYWKSDEASGNGTDSSGNNNTSTVSGSDNYGSGKFGNGLRSGVATTNLSTNPSVETNTTGWTYWLNSGTGTAVRSNDTALFGSYSYKSTMTVNGSMGHYAGTAAVSPSTTYSVSGWVKITSWGGSNFPIYMREIYPTGNGQCGSTMYTASGVTNGWVRFSGTCTTRADTTNLLVSYYLGDVGQVVYVDGIQIEQSSLVTPYIDGSLGTGYSWSGTAHASTSIRTASTATTTTNVNDTTGTIAYWFKSPSLDTSAQCPFGPTDGDTNGGTLFGLKSSGVFLTHKYASGVSVTPQYSSALSNNTWYHVAYTWDNTSRQGNLYVNGALQQSVSYAQAITIGEYLQNLGTCTATGYTTFNGTLDDIRAYNRALSGKEVSDLYNWAPGPYTYLSFDEGTGNAINDKSGNGYSGTWNGSGTHWTSGKFGKAAHFDGSSDYVSFSSLPKPTNLPVTIEFWAQPTTSTPVGIFDSAPSQTYVFRNYSSGNVEWWNASPSISLGLTAATWTHLAFIYDYSGGNQTITWYKNGIQQTTGSSTAAGTWAWTTFRLGNINGGSSGWYSGDLDEFKIYNYARTSKQITEDMNAGHPAPGSPVGSAVGYWKMDEGRDNACSGGTNDVCNSGNGGSALDGAQSGMAVPATATSGWSNSGKFGKVLSFDGGNDYVNLGNSTSLQIKDFTFSAWVYFNSIDANEGIVTKVSSSNKAGWALVEQLDNKLYFYYGLPWSNVSSNSNYLVTGQWIHMVVAKTGLTVNFYRNGVPWGTSTLSQDISDASLYNLLLGRLYTDTDNYYLDGKLDEVKVYNSALTEDEIKLDYNHGSGMVLGSTSTDSSGNPGDNSSSREYCIPGDTTSCSAPVAEWKMDEKTGANAYDTSGNGNTGTITGATWSTGKVGAGLNFNGGTDTVTVANSLSTKSVEFWVYPTSTTQNLIDLRTAATAANISVSGGTISAAGFTTPIIYVNGTVSSTLAANAWQYVAITTGTAITANAIQFGRISTTSLTGKLDSIRIFDYARTPAQVAYDYNRGGPVGWWKMDECQGGNANDSSGNGNNGTITIGATGTNASAGTCTGSAGEAWKDGATGKYNSSLEFDLLDDLVTANVSGLSTQYVSVSAWIKANSFINFNNFVNHNWIGNGWTIFGINTNRIYFGVAQGGTQYNTYVDNLSIGSWYHVTGVYDGSNVKIYLNGNFVRQTALSNATLDASATDIKIGRYSDSQIDDVKIFNYALTGTQVKSLYNGGAAVQFAPITGTP